MSINRMDRQAKPLPMTEAEIIYILRSMESSSSFDTKQSLATSLEPDAVITFTEKHLEYLRAHPKISARSYLANLHTMVKIRS